ncbi:MAG: hypothetical protein HY744_19950 [Deltaproteobacteria bacterium]|nr:hypothetical protein [Deltaproteobacteria bacterium]
MTIDLDGLRDRHPLLPENLAHYLAMAAALALQRRHRPPVQLPTRICGKAAVTSLSWQWQPREHALQLDERRATEDGAEAVALALVHEALSWTVVRRMQRRTAGCADWLMQDGRDQVALEVSGTDTGDVDARLRQKLEQAARSGRRRFGACVVRFADPLAVMEAVA